MSSTIASSTRTESVDWSRLLRAGGIAIVGSVIANVIIYYVAVALGAIPQTLIIPNAGGPLTVVPVITATLMGVIGGIAVFAALARFTRRPITIFRIVALVVLVLSFATPFTVPGAPVGFIVALELMHIAAAAITIWALTTQTQRAR